MIRALVVCPGRGSYGAAQLGSLPKPHPILSALDTFRRSLGRTTLSELDGAERLSPRLHMAGENASLLTFAATAIDLAALDPHKVEVIAVAGNSMGWYSALYAAGALDLTAAARLVETLGHYQAEGVIGGQLLYPLVGEDWRPDPALIEAARAALDLDGVYESIRFGGSLVFGATDEGIAALRRALPLVKRGERELPVQLVLHSAFHTPLMAPIAECARRDLGDLEFRSPRQSLVDGTGRVHRLWAAPAALADYTLGEQIIAPFDFASSVTTALGEFAPDSVVLPGPGDTLGAAVAQTMIATRWRGLRDRLDFDEAQAGEHPPILSMARPPQRRRVAM